MNRARMELGDALIPFEFAFRPDGVRSYFSLEHKPINDVDPTVDPVNGLKLYVNGVIVPITSWATYGISIDHNNGLLVFDEPPTLGDTWEVEGTKWRYFSDLELQTFLDTAIDQHKHNRSNTSDSAWTMNDIEEVEEYPIALYAVIQALWALATDASYDIDILAPDGVNIPRSERYRQLMDMIAARQSQYDELTANLNIGIKRIEVYTARRTSKVTGRLVPVVLSSEFDDYSRPKRVVMPRMLAGTKPIDSGIGTYDIDVVSGDAISFLVDLPVDLTGATVKNAVMRSPMSGRSVQLMYPVRAFTQEIVDPAEGLIRLSMTGTETRWLTYNMFWELQVQLDGEEDSRTYLRGMVRATNNEVVR